MNLQKAQDLIQQAGVFYSTSFDATGAGRDQIVDSNWIVVSQTPAIGEVITEGSADLGAVKLSEPNDCSTTPAASTVATVTPTTAEAPVTTAEAAVTTAEAPVTTAEAPATTAEPPVTTARPRATTTPKTTAQSANAYYANCDEARAAGAAPISQGEPGYRSGLDRDHDGVACDK
jgi:hypothetical protein